MNAGEVATSNKRHDALSPKRCVACGYALRGLPEDVRRCPECGWGWDANTIALSGDAPTGVPPPPGMSVTPTQFAWITAALGLVMVCTAFPMAGWKGASMLTVLVVGMAAAGRLGMAWKASRRGRHWVVLTPAGFDMDRVWREPKLNPWDRAVGRLIFDENQDWLTFYLSPGSKGWTRVTSAAKKRARQYNLSGDEQPGVSLFLPIDAAEELAAALSTWNVSDRFELDLPLRLAVETRRASMAMWAERLVDVT